MRTPLPRILFVILTAVMLAGGAAVLTPATAAASGPARGSLSVGPELANEERPASVALTTSYALLALTLEPLAAAARGEEPRADRRATGAPAARPEAGQRTGRAIDMTSSSLLDGWLVRGALLVLGALIVLAGMLELNGKANRRRTVGV